MRKLTGHLKDKQSYKLNKTKKKEFKQAKNHIVLIAINIIE